MSLIVPDSSVKLYSNIPITDVQQIVFKSRTEQNTYFATKKTAEKADCSYIRKTGRLRIEYSAATVLAADYISFRNESFENTTFYAKIVDFEYVNNTTTDILYQIDRFQTFMFDVRYHSSSIIREHLTESQHDLAVANPWRRDIPELLTDEDLPCSSNLEKIYDTNLLSYTGERFRVPYASAAHPDSYDNVITMFLTRFDVAAITSETGGLEDYLNFISQFDYVPNTGSDAPQLTFSSWKNGFANSYAILGIRTDLDGPASAVSKLNEALKFLASYSITSAVIGLYVLPNWAFSSLLSTDSDAAGTEIEFTVPKLTVNNPKLNTFPFRYLRVKSPKDTKEYRLDLFTTLNSGGTKCKFYLTANGSGLPTVVLCPVNYMYTNNGQLPAGIDELYYKSNFYERIEFSEFPQMGFSSDAYLTYLSSQYNESTKNNTYSNTVQLQNSFTSTLKGRVMGESIKSFDGTVPIRGLNPDNTYNIGFGTDAQRELAASIIPGYSKAVDTQQAIDIRKEAYAARNNGVGYNGVFRSTKRAFVNDQYTPGGSTGTLPYQFQNMCFYVEIATLADDILDKYDDYLTCNGYKSLRNGIPHVCKYMQNEAETPHFVTFDGDTFTYVQTENMKVTGAIQEACTAIENLFNAGCRFLKVV